MTEIYLEEKDIKVIDENYKTISDGRIEIRSTNPHKLRESILDWQEFYVTVVGGLDMTTEDYIKKIKEINDKSELWDKYVKSCKNEECPKCGSKNFTKEVDWINDIEEEVETFWCKDCKHDWLGNMV